MATHRKGQLIQISFPVASLLQNIIASITGELRTFQAQFEDAMEAHQKETKRLNEHIKDLAREKELVGREVGMALLTMHWFSFLLNIVQRWPGYLIMNRERFYLSQFELLMQPVNRCFVDEAFALLFLVDEFK